MNEKSLILAIDCGTSSVRTIIFDSLTGKQLSVSQSRWKRKPDEHGATHFDTKNNWRLICNLIHKTISGYDPKKILGITTTSFRHGLVCIDKNGEEVFACHNADARSNEQVKKLKETGLGTEVFKISGDYPTINALPILMWLRENSPVKYNTIWKALSVAGWVTYKLSEKAFIEPSMASATCLFDIHTLTWSSEILKAVKINEAILPSVVESDQVIGGLTNDVAKEVGLIENTPVYVSLGDTQAAMTATNDVSANRSSVIGGTFWLHAQTTDRPITDETMRMRTQCHCVKKIWFNEGCSFYVGPIFSWFVENFCSNYSKSNEKTFKELTEKAAKVPAGAYGIQMVFSNLTNVSNWKHASPAILNWDIFDSKRSNKAVFFRALLENAALLTYGEFLMIKEITGKWPEMLTFSGGASNNYLLAQIIADTVGVPVRILKNKECSALGGVMTASVSTGIYDSLNSCADYFLEIEKEFRPFKRNHRVYKDKYMQWRDIYKRMLELSDNGLTKHLWKAAGS
ncbi:MAG: hypothetical protein FXF54_03015 [Kosmotoga sp.]|nr:MAG: hypothetical protein FXF54_03015 [Kosmotoga sp.]